MANTGKLLTWAEVCAALPAYQRHDPAYQHYRWENIAKAQRDLTRREVAQEMVAEIERCFDPCDWYSPEAGCKIMGIATQDWQVIKERWLKDG